MGLLLIVPGALLPWILETTKPGALYGAVAGWIFGFMAAPSTILEVLAESRPLSRRRELQVAAGTAVLATVALVLAAAEFIFTVSIVDEGSTARALERTWRAADDLQLGAFVVFFPVTLPFVVAVIGRMRRRPLWREVASGALSGVLAFLPTIAIVFHLGALDDLDELGWWERRALFELIVVPAIAVPICVLLLSSACRLAERADARIVRHLEGA